MLKTTPDTPQIATPHGLCVVPDVLVFPLRARTYGSSPLAALENLERLEAAVQTAVPTAELEQLGYRSWTEKLAGKGLRGRGIRYRTSANLRLKVNLGAHDSTRLRRRALETLRAALVPLDDGDQLTVGTPSWGVEDPEVHRDAWVQQLRTRADVVQSAFGVSADLTGAVGELEVESVGPRHAYVRFAAQLRVRPDSPPCRPVHL